MARACDSEQAGTSIEVTQAMIEAGVAELREHHIGDDLGYAAETAFRAMAYLRPSASLIISCK